MLETRSETEYLAFGCQLVNGKKSSDQQDNSPLAISLFLQLAESFLVSTGRLVVLYFFPKALKCKMTGYKGDYDCVG